MRLYYLFAFLHIISFSQAQIIKLYENTNFDGISKSFSALEKVKTLQTWEDRISSIEIQKGYQVTLFEDNNFKGKQVTLTSDLAHLKSIKFNDKISSIIIEKYDKNSDAAIIYDNTDYGGLMYPLKVGIYTNLKKQTWLNDKATSVKINPGYRIVAYEHYDFKGNDIIISENQANLKTIKWNDKISSIKVEISNERQPPKNEFVFSIYKGSYFSEDSKNYELGKVNKLDNWNDEISSIKINKNYQVTVYEHGDLKGKKTTITSDQANLKMMKWNDKISSFKVEKFNPESNISSLYENSHFSGKFTTLGIGEYRSLNKQTWFNDKISSIKINEGYKIILYKDSDFKGAKKTLYSSYTSLKAIKFNDNISSIKIEKLLPGELENIKPDYKELVKNIRSILIKVDSVKTRLGQIEQSSRGEKIINPPKNAGAYANTIPIKRIISESLYNKKEFEFKKINNGDINYVGLLKNGVPEGLGRMSFKNGDTFIGELKQGKADGFGLITKPDGTYLKGLFTTKKDEIFCLYGEGKSKNGDNTSTGNIHNNKPFGKVKIVHSSGAVYEGDFFNDMPWTGKGKIINGDMSIEGEFVEAQGLAFIKDVNMTIYGEVLLTKNKKFNVYGFYLSSDGDKFSGTIKNGNWGKSIPKEEVKKVLKQKYKNFDNKKLQLVISD